MRILYGIQLNGNGHITRSLELISQLKAKGYEVDVIASGGNYSIELPDYIKKFKGLSMYFNKSGRINKLKTTLSLNLFKLVKDINYDCSGYDLVISDFEPISAYSAKKYKVKSIGISNQVSITKSSFFESLFIKYFAPCDYYIPLDYKNGYQPIISEKFLNGKVSDEDFYLVYLAAYSLEHIENELKYSDKKFKVYSSDVVKDYVYNNIEFKKSNKDSFQSDLLKCSGVITASGFSTTSEALVLGKRLWSIPIKGQFEQIDNAIKLNKLGIYTDDLTSENLENWLNNYTKIDYEWINPIESIVSKIKEIYES
jgi:UDP:flavonoid glycosyltransferase YjiC (YdhE family)